MPWGEDVRVLGLLACGVIVLNERNVPPTLHEAGRWYACSESSLCLRSLLAVQDFDAGYYDVSYSAEGAEELYAEGPEVEQVGLWKAACCSRGFACLQLCLGRLLQASRIPFAPRHVMHYSCMTLALWLRSHCTAGSH